MGAGVEGKDHAGSGSWRSTRGWGGWGWEDGAGNGGSQSLPKPRRDDAPACLCGFFQGEEGCRWGRGL